MKKLFVLIALLLILTACSEQGTGAHLMKRVSGKDSPCYLYIPLAWEDDTVDTAKRLAAHVTDEYGTATIEVTTEEQNVPDESEEYWAYWLSDEWWADFWEDETKPTWENPSVEEYSLNNSACQRCIYTVGDTRYTEIVSARYHELFRLTTSEPVSSDHSADFEEIFGAFIWN